MFRLSKLAQEADYFEIRIEELRQARKPEARERQIRERQARELEEDIAMEANIHLAQLNARFLKLEHKNAKLEREKAELVDDKIRLRDRVIEWQDRHQNVFYLMLDERRAHLLKEDELRDKLAKAEADQWSPKLQSLLDKIQKCANAEIKAKILREVIDNLAFLPFGCPDEMVVLQKKLITLTAGTTHSDQTPVDTEKYKEEAERAVAEVVRLRIDNIAMAEKLKNLNALGADKGDGVYGG